MILSQSFIKRVITAEIKTGKNASGTFDQDQKNSVSCVSSSRTTWQNLDGTSLIQRP